MPIGKKRMVSLLLDAEHLTNTTYAGYQLIDLLLRIVERERGTDRSFDAKCLHQWLRTMMSGADGNT